MRVALFVQIFHCQLEGENTGANDNQSCEDFVFVFVFSLGSHLLLTLQERCFADRGKKRQKVSHVAGKLSNFGNHASVLAQQTTLEATNDLYYGDPATFCKPNTSNVL